MKSRIGRRIALAALLLGILLLLPAMRGLTVEQILTYTPSNPALAAGVLLGIFALKNVLVFLPVSVLAMAIGMLFPRGFAIAWLYVCLSAELSIGYWMGRRMGMARILDKLNTYERVRGILDFLKKNGQAACFLTRLIPMPYPVDVGSMYFGAVEMPFVRYLLFSLLGLSAQVLPFLIAGKSISNPLSKEFLIPFGIAVAVAIGVYFLYRVFEKRLQDKSEAREDPKAR